MNREVVTKAFVYKTLERFIAQGISFIIGIIIARLLDPSDFGALAIMVVFINIANEFVQGGLNLALVQIKEEKKEDFSTVFFLSLGISVLCYIVIFFCAPFLVRFYKMPELLKPLRTIAVVLFAGALNSVQTARVTRDMQFKIILICNTISAIVSGLTGIILAYNSFGLWSLVIQQIVFNYVNCIVMWLFVGWRPILTFSCERAKILWNFGWKIMASNLIDSLHNDIRTLLLGKFFSKSILAYFDRGKQIPKFIVVNFNQSIRSVMLPAMSTKQEDDKAVKNMLKNTIKMSSFILFPCMIGLLSVSPTLIPLLLTDKWTDCIPFVSLSCLLCMTWPIHSAHCVAYNAIGKSEIRLKITIITKIIDIILLVSLTITTHNPLLVMGWQTFSDLFMGFIIYPAISKRIFEYGIFEQLKDLKKTIISSMLIYVVSMFPVFFHGNDLRILCIQIISGICIYVGSSMLLKNDMYDNCKIIIKKILSK